VELVSAQGARAPAAGRARGAASARSGLETHSRLTSGSSRSSELDHVRGQTPDMAEWVEASRPHV
jgi:hypothetical protein